jgi:uncharacterized protein YciI
MYIALLKYIKPLDLVDLALPDRTDWLDKQYQAGCFLASGKIASGDGGVIVVKPMPRGKLDALLASDPFVAQKLASYEVVDFKATRTAPELAKINEASLT